MKRITSIALAAVALAGVLALGSPSAVAARSRTMNHMTKMNSKNHHRKHHHKRHRGHHRAVTQKKSY